MAETRGIVMAISMLLGCHIRERNCFPGTLGCLSWQKRYHGANQSAVVAKTGWDNFNHMTYLLRGIGDQCTTYQREQEFTCTKYPTAENEYIWLEHAYILGSGSS